MGRPPGDDDTHRGLHLDSPQDGDSFRLVFQLPLVLFVLGWFGIVTSEGLRAKRRTAIVAAFVVAMFLTPPDPMSQLMMAVPLCLLYELSIWAVWLRERA